MARDYLEGVEYLNNGYDMGKPGLRGFKKHLSAHTMMGKYLCTVAPITEGLALSGCTGKSAAERLTLPGYTDPAGRHGYREPCISPGSAGRW
jgi:hypothetical protein